jgi:peptide deformylase
MSILPIVRFPDQRLRETSRDVVSFDDDLKRLVADMTDTMYLAEGAGLSAIQVGVALRLFLVDPEVAGRQPTDPPMAFINPRSSACPTRRRPGTRGVFRFLGYSCR